MRWLGIGLLSVALLGAPQVFAEDEMSLQPQASDGFGRIFSRSQALTQALDTMVWYIMFGGTVDAGAANWRKVGPTCNFHHGSTSSRCTDQLTDGGMNDMHQNNREIRRHFHNTLTYLHGLRKDAISNIDAIGGYYKDKSWGSGNARCNIYAHHGDLSQDWPRFLTAYRDDRRGSTIPARSKELLGLYFAYAKRTYSDYVETMSKLLPDLRDLCESN